MAEVNDYVTGRILNNTRLALYSLKLLIISIIGPRVKKRLQKRIGRFEPKLADMNTAPELVQQSKKCAVGERVCRAIHKNSEFTEAVFLDELAGGMVKAGKARYATKEEAIDTLNKYIERNPIIVSKVSGSYMEICRSSPEVCVYWNAERCFLKCLDKAPAQGARDI